MKRVPLKRTAFTPKGTVRRKAKNRQRRAPDGFSEQTKSAVRRRSGNRCEICGGRPSAFHHRKLRGHGDHRDVNCLHLCLDCHTFVHHNVEVSYVKGWLVQSFKDPAEVPLRAG